MQNVLEAEFQQSSNHPHRVKVLEKNFSLLVDYIAFSRISFQGAYRNDHLPKNMILSETGPVVPKTYRTLTKKRKTARDISKY